MQPQQEYVVAMLKRLGAKGATTVESCKWERPVTHLTQRCGELIDHYGLPIVKRHEEHSDGYHVRCYWGPAIENSQIHQLQFSCECGSWYRRGLKCASCGRRVKYPEKEKIFCGMRLG